LGKKQTQAEWLNDQTYLMYYDMLYDYALSMFEWEGLPDEINKRFLEKTILDNGSAVFFNDDQFGYMAMPVVPKGYVNPYLEPIQYEAVSVGYNKSLDLDTGVIIWNNYSRKSIKPILEAFAFRLYKVERAMDVNIAQQKFPLIVMTDESQRMTMQNLMEKWDGNELFIFGNKKGFDPESVKALPTGVPYVADKLMEYRHNLWNNAMTFLGIGNAKQDKKERLVSDEVSANDEQIMSSRYVMLRARQDACELINKKFGLNVSVDFKLNLDQAKQMEEAEDNDDSGGDTE
jgi:hypothetical protein